MVVQKFILGGFGMDNRKYMPAGLKLAHAYVPFQVMNKVYSPREALCKGTLFPELYMPFEMKKESKK